MAPKVLFIQHDPVAPPAMLADAFAEVGYDTDVFAPSQTTSRFPGTDQFDVLVSLGARVSVYDRRLLSSWLPAEMALLRQADAEEIPVLGVCFGGQLLAQTHGGVVSLSSAPEIGWVDITTDEPDLVPPGPWYQWHSDSWSVPPGSVEIGRNANGSQAFRLRSNLAVQFHPELDAALLDEWLTLAPEPHVNAAAVDITELRQRAQVEQPQASERVRRLVDGFLRHCATREAAAVPTAVPLRPLQATASSESHVKVSD